MSARDAVVALRRFGLGARPGDIAAVSGDPRGFVLDGLSRRADGRFDDADLDPASESIARFLVEQREKRLADRRMANTAQASPPTTVETAPPPSPPKPASLARRVLVEEATRRFAHAVATPDGFVERLVMFWSAHFCISADKGGLVRIAAGAFERETIRPHVLGRFRDMLIAVETHPAMIAYLDNQQSTGPNSRNAKGRGLNENLAREILELHTLGVQGGYDQSDVTNFARILTGWTFATLDRADTRPGQFFFARARHEPGSWTVLGRRYAAEGQHAGLDVLEDLGRHPATARHIARKFARHFVGDAAPTSLISRLEASFRDTDGDLAALARTLVEAPEAWGHPPAKILPPTDYLIALCRALDVAIKPEILLKFGMQLGQPMWRPPSPKGWPEEDEAWIAPSAVHERLRIAQYVAGRANRGLDPRTLAVDLFGDAMSAETTRSISRAEVREQGLALLLMSPEFQRR